MNYYPELGSHLEIKSNYYWDCEILLTKKELENAIDLP